MHFTGKQIIWVFIALLGMSGCGPNPAILARKIDNRAYESAVRNAAGDPGMESHLAAQIVRQMATEDETQSLELVLLLRRSGDFGATALQSIRDLTAKTDETRRLKTLAKIALSQRRRPRRELLAKYMTSQWSDVRTAAIRTFGHRLDKNQLMKLALDKDQRIRFRAIGELGKIPDDPQVATLLKDALKRDPAPGVRATAARQAQALGKDGIDALRDALKDENAGVQFSAVRGLAKLDSPVATALIADLLAGPMTELTVVAASELSFLGNKEGAKRFADALEDNNPSVRAAALVHLDKARLANANLLRKKMLDDEFGQVVYLAATYLKNQKEYKQATVEALVAVHSRVDPYRERAGYLLATMNVEEYVILVKDTLTALEQNQSEELPSLIANTQEAKHLRPEFVQLMGHPDPNTRLAAAKAILAQIH